MASAPCQCERVLCQPVQSAFPERGIGSEHIFFVDLFDNEITGKQTVDLKGRYGKRWPFHCRLVVVQRHQKSGRLCWQQSEELLHIGRTTLAGHGNQCRPIVKGIDHTDFITPEVEKVRQQSFRP